MNVTPRKWYVVTTDSTCEVTDANGKLLCTAEAGEQKLFFATTPTVTLSDETATVGEANFKTAAAALRLLGGGSKNALPAGYLQAYFLESTGTQFALDESFVSSSEIELECKYRFEKFNSTNFVYCVIGTSSYRNAMGEFGEWVSRVDYGKSMTDLTSWELRAKQDFIFKKEKERNFWDGKEYKASPEQSFEQVCTMSLFGHNTHGYPMAGRIYWLNTSVRGKAFRRYAPAVGKNGEPCMYDTVTRKPFFNSGTGQFIAGFTMKQARKLGKLPVGTTLKVSLPVGWQEDESVTNAIAEATSKGCVIEQAEDWSEGDAAASSTYALRRVWVKRTQDDIGNYVDADGSRWRVEWCVDVFGAAPETLGYERYRSVEVARDYWGLTEYTEPEAEELLTIE